MSLIKKKTPDRGGAYKFISGCSLETVLFQGDKVYYFYIITTAPNDQIGKIHSRMPAIIPDENVTKWLESGSAALELLKPLNKPMMINAV